MTAPTVQLTYAALNSLRQMVGGTGWAKSVEDICRGGQLLIALPEIEVPATDNKPALLAWADQPIEVTLTEKQRDLAKKALKYFAEQGAVPPTKHTVILYTALGLFES